MNADANGEPKKRRGRKPKVTSTVVAPVSTSTTTTLSVEEAPVSTLTPVKRGRKPKVVFAFDAQQSGKDEDDIDVILKLKLQSSESIVNANGHSIEIDGNGNDSTVFAYNEGMMSNFSLVSHAPEVKRAPVPDGMTMSECYNSCSGSSHDGGNTNVSKVGTNKVVELLKVFEEKTKTGEWPINTCIACYWCCHKFDTPPIGLPCKYIDGKFYVTGCFCSLECAAAYNVMYIRDSRMEERMNLLTMLSRELGYETIVKPAPPREILQYFGGNMTIEEFRSCGTKNKSISTNFPPMVVLINQLEEVNDCDVSNKLKYVPLDMDRIDRYKEKIKLRRTLPVNANKNTLENVMQFSIKTC